MVSYHIRCLERQCAALNFCVLQVCRVHRLGTHLVATNAGDRSGQRYVLDLLGGSSRERQPQVDEPVQVPPQSAPSVPRSVAAAAGWKTRGEVLQVTRKISFISVALTVCPCLCAQQQPLGVLCAAVKPSSSNMHLQGKSMAA